MQKDWVLTVGIDKFPLTVEEKDKYLTAVNQGAKYVQIRGMVLGTTFQTLVPKQATEGKWQCDYGKWHVSSDECPHGYDFIELEDGSYRRIEKKDVKEIEA